MGQNRAVQLVVGAGHLDRFISDAIALLERYRQDTGCYYLDYEPFTPRNIVLPEDLSVTLLVNSQAGWKAFRSLEQYGYTIKLDTLPQKPLEQTSKQERRQVSELIARMAQWSGFAASIATKVLHKKRPDLIPILDNQAIFGAYMNKNWPQKAAHDDSVKKEELIFLVLEWIAFDITRPENKSAWSLLQSIEPSRTLIQLFDSIWWMHFRQTQPVPKNPRMGKSKES